MEKYARLLMIFDKVKTIHSRIKVQKTLYVLKSLGFPVGERYEYRNYGPYSQELASELKSLVNSEFLRETSVEGEQPTEEGDVSYQRYDLSIAPKGRKFLEAFIGQHPEFEADASKMANLAAELDKFLPSTLELVATIMFLEDQGYPKENIIPVLKSLKPQFTDHDIDIAGRIIQDLGRRFQPRSKS